MAVAAVAAVAVAGVTPSSTPAHGSCTTQLAKDGCSTSLGKEACDTCAGAHQADLRAAGCTSTFVKSFCAGKGPGSQAYSTTFEKAEPDNWELETACSHCGSHSHGGDECTQFTSSAVQYAAVAPGNRATPPLPPAPLTQMFRAHCCEQAVARTLPPHHSPASPNVGANAAVGTSPSGARSTSERSPWPPAGSQAPCLPG